MHRTFFAVALACAALAPLSFAQKLATKAPIPNEPEGTQLPTLTKVLEDGARFGTVRVGERAFQRISFTNTSGRRRPAPQLAFDGADAPAFRVVEANRTGGNVGTGANVNVLSPGASQSYLIAFTPQRRGKHTTGVSITGGEPKYWKASQATLSGVAVGPVGDEIRINVGGPQFVDQASQEWAADYGAWRGAFGGAQLEIAGTDDDDLYRSQRVGPRVRYALEVPARGNYEVTLHFAELIHALPGRRVFDVLVEGDVMVPSLDLAAVAGGATAHTETFVARVRDGWLDLDLDASVGFATVSAIEIRAIPFLHPRPDRIDFGALATGDSQGETIALRNLGAAALTLETIEFRLGGSGNSEAFALTLGGTTYSGSVAPVVYQAAVVLEPGASTDALLTFAPIQEQYDTPSLVLGYRGVLDVTPRFVELPLVGLGGHEGDPFLHPVNVHSVLAIDYDADGSEPITFDASGSHTHELGQSIVDWAFELDGTPIGSGAPVVVHDADVGAHAVQLTIADDGTPTRTLPLTTTFDVVPTDRIPGVLALYYPASAGGASALLDAVPTGAEFVEVLDMTRVDGPATVGGSPLTTNVMVRLSARIDVASSGAYTFVASGGVDRRLELDGTAVTGARVLAPGTHEVEARFAVDDLSDLPLEVTLSIDGATPSVVASTQAMHDEGALVPVINSMPAVGTTLGGNEIRIEGLGFFPSGSVTVQWGAATLTSSDFTSLSAEQIRFASPPGAAGPISVSVQTPRGSSNAKTFVYDPGGPVPIDFRHTRDYMVPQPTAAAWGPDGKLYVAILNGRIAVVEFADDWSLSNMTLYPGVSTLTNHDSLGIAFDPYDPYDPNDPGKPVRVYVAHGEHFANGGSSFSGPSEYSGQVSVLEGPAFDTPLPFVTGLPTSNHDHAVNGIAFDNNGDFLICVGGNTNAGVPHPNIGDLPESPLSGALLLARTSLPSFNGAVEYVDTLTGLPSDDQVYGGGVDVAPGVDVEVYASGLRNPFGLTLTTSGVPYVTDNGPNTGFGAASTSATTETPDPYDDDELLRIEPGAYYGHANRNRGRTDPRQNVYHPASSGADIPGVFTQALATVPSSTDGVDEYRADTFQGQMRGDIVAQKWYSNIYRVELSDDGQDALSVTTLNSWAPALGLVTAPGGAMVAIDYTKNRLRIIEPFDAAAQPLQVYDIFPWRAPATGGARFELGGVGFGSLADTTVTIGGRPAQLTRVDATRIVGLVPEALSFDDRMLDVVVTVGTASDTYAQGFRYLPGRGLELGKWETLADVPQSLGEVSTAVVNGILYVFGEGSGDTLRYDVLARQWLAPGAPRPYPGHHHSAEVLGSKLVLIGGLGGGAEGRVQIYDPGSDSWNVGTDMPWAGGSVSTAVIGGKVYAAGGIVGSYTVNNTAVFDPLIGGWTALAPMPSGRNHAGNGTDGERLFVFGGRRGGNFVANGFDDVMVFDPATGAWSTSALDPSLAPLPAGRGGMGRAVWYRDEFYVFGGETLNDPLARPGSNVYDRVDVYDPETNTWRLEAPMQVPRHGIDAVVFQGRILLPGGGTNAGFSSSSQFDQFVRR